jgi:hypothetical protein
LGVRSTQHLQSSVHLSVSSTFGSEMQRPSGAQLRQRPPPSVDPRPRPSDESRLDVPLDAREASYLAGFAGMMSLRRVSMKSQERLMAG